MPRRARNYISDFPYHITQRGNNRQICFFDPGGFQFYLDLWRDVSRRYQLEVHAYCLMNNHVHFLVTPQNEDAISNTMRVVGSRYAQAVNKRFGRTGTLWEGRHRASLVQSDRYLLACYRYIELNPVRAGLVVTPAEYRWSSYRANALGAESWLHPHQEYLGLGVSAKPRQRTYRQLFETLQRQEEVQFIRKMAFHGHPLADARFCSELSERYGMHLGHTQTGRPRSQ